MVKGVFTQALALFALVGVGCHGRHGLPRSGASGLDAALASDSKGEPEFDVASVDTAPEDDLGPLSSDAGTYDSNPGTSCSREHRYPDPPCPSGWFLFTDTRSFLCYAPDSDPRCSPTTGHMSTPWGDGACYRPCKSNTDCPDPCMPFCRKIWLYQNNEHCSTTRSVCLSQDRDFCDVTPSQSSH